MTSNREPNTSERLPAVAGFMPGTDLSDAALDAVTGGTHASLVNNLAKVFGWSPKQVNQILGRGDVPYLGGGGESQSSSDSGAE